MKINRITHEDPVGFWESLRRMKWREIVKELPCMISQFLDKPDRTQLVDEVVITNANVHLERMDDGCSVLIISDPLTDKRVNIAIWAAGRDDLRVRAH